MARRGARRSAGGVGEAVRKRHAWLELLQTSGPFLTLPVVHRVFPDGLPPVQALHRAELRGLTADMLDDRGASRHKVIEYVLRDVLDWQHHLRLDTDLPDTLAQPVTEHPGVVLRPDFAFYAEDADDPDADDEDVDADSGDEDADDEGDDEEGTSAGAADAPSGPWLMLGMYAAWGSHPLKRTTSGGWTASPVERLAVLLRARDVPVGLVTDGRWWALVWAPRDAATGAAVWDGGLFSDEADSLKAFVALLSRARFLAVQVANTLPMLFRESLERQEEVTDTLGRQVREAVEMLVERLDQLDRDSERTLLDGVDDDEFYSGVVTLMMRVVFLLFAEERRLLPSDDDLYVTAYSVGHLVEQLDRQARVAGEQTLEHHYAAWHRLLAVTRAIHSGVAHEDLRMPAYGGGLFDPDRYPWLEGRKPGQSLAEARPPAVDDRTVLRMLRAVQYVQIGGERRRLTFRALDVEQIGYVYEGLLELEVRTADDVVLGLIRPSGWPRVKKAEVKSERCEITLTELRDAQQNPDDLAGWLADHCALNKQKVADRLADPPSLEDTATATLGLLHDPAAVSAIAPIAGLLRQDEHGRPLPAAITLPGGRYVARSTRRAATGTHYTPSELAEEVARHALEPLVYRPGPLERPDGWRLRPSSEIKALRVADIAMGSGAFLVAACRYLADRLVEAWQEEGRSDALHLTAQRTGRRAAADSEVEQVLLEARREVAEHCLYGVDINPLAVEMAKLSLWLITMDRERPFGFLDDRLRSGDSLLGLTNVEQLETLHVDPVAGRRLHAFTLDYANVRALLQEAADIRRRITSTPVVTIRDVEHKTRLLAEAEHLTTTLNAVADLVTATGLTAAKLKGKKQDNAFIAAAWEIGNHSDEPEWLREHAEPGLQEGRPSGTVPREPLHWPLAFPEVFADTNTPGFDAIIGNPPFLGGKKVSGQLGTDYLAWLQRWDGDDVKGSVDLAARFVVRAERLLNRRGQLGYVTTNTLVEGDTLTAGLLQSTQRGLTIRRGRSAHPWPSRSANLQIVAFWATWVPLATDVYPQLDGEEVPKIGPDLQPVGRIEGRPLTLQENEGLCFIGSYVLGDGFVMGENEAISLINDDPRNADVLRPYLIGKDINQRPDCSPSRWVINFFDWPLSRAEEYPEVLGIVRHLVKPERDQKKRDAHRRNWWRYADHRVGLYKAAAELDHVLAISLVGSTLLPVRVPTGPVFAHACGVFALDDFAGLAILSSSAHQLWAIRYTSTMRTDIRYAPSDVFVTFPRPCPTPALEELGRRLDEERRGLMLSRGWGLTTTYNHVHDPAERDNEVQKLRELHDSIDHAVLDAYGWELDLQIGHHPTKIGTRWTVGKEARFELLDLLLEENLRRAGVLEL